VSEADIIWHLYDATDGWTEADESIADQLPTNAVRIANKADLLPAEGLAISAITGQGIEQLHQEVERLIPTGLDLPLISDRQAEEIRRATETLAEAQMALSQDIPADLAITFLRETMVRIGRITSETAGSVLL
jgi:tRNA U34 5-carboxymethylaminomethyl modifying GTPase MnmE/TrmE